MHIRWMSSLCFGSLLLLMGSLTTLRAAGQCSGIATTPTAAADCAGRALPQDRTPTIDPSHPYALAELIDIAERNNPRTRILWERARQRAEALGVEKSAYFPVLAGLAAFGDSRSSIPNPATALADLIAADGPGGLWQVRGRTVQKSGKSFVSGRPL